VRPENSAGIAGLVAERATGIAGLVAGRATGIGRGAAAGPRPVRRERSLARQAMK
jgi:hypothetical protein